MKIDRIEIYPLVGVLDEPFGWSQRWTDRRQQTVVRVTCDDGVYGWGETGGHHETLPMYRALAASVIGEDPVRRGAIWNRTVGAVYQGGGYAGMATSWLSALDMALHDLLARAQGVPVSELLGGRMRDSVEVYATGLYYTPDDLDDKTWQRFIDEGVGYAEAGFHGMKMKIGGLTMREDADRVHALRRAVGDDVRIMVDANEAYDPMTALRMADMMADADLTWFEEACGSRNLADNLYVTERSPIPTSGGESMRTRRDGAQMMRERVYDILQPEICAVGGTSELKFVAGMAEAFNVRFVPHFWGTGISFASILHVLSTVPVFPPAAVSEPYVNEVLTEFDQTPHPIREVLTDPFFTQTGGRVEVPSVPGLGIEVNEDALTSLLDGEMADVRAE